MAEDSCDIELTGNLKKAVDEMKNPIPGVQRTVASIIDSAIRLEWEKIFPRVAFPGDSQENFSTVETLILSLPIGSSIYRSDGPIRDWEVSVPENVPNRSNKFHSHKGKVLLDVLTDALLQWRKRKGY